MTISKIYSLIWGGVVAIAMLTLTACSSSDEPNQENIISDATWRTSGEHHTSAAGYEADLKIDLTAPSGSSYRVEVTEGSEWCWTSRLNKTSMREGVMALKAQSEMIYLDENTSAERNATIEVTFQTGERVSLTLTQGVYEKPAIYDRRWAELPDYSDNNSTVTVTHYADLAANKKARNYTVCFNIERGYADWVAYPLHKCYMSGGYDRSDAWQYDPKIPTQYQPDLSRGSYSDYGWVRGHQLMSYHRYVSYSSELNAQTFYSSNIMPQDYDFNSGLWNEMEGVCTNKGRNCADTLYIVTGTYGVQGTTRDKAGKSVSIPQYCFKVLLCTRSGKTGKHISEIENASELMAIGYWAKNSSSSNSGTLKSYTCSVAEIEQNTGYKFFPTINEQIASEVKSQHNPEDWGIN